MSRYRLDPEDGVIHDTRSGYIDGYVANLVPGGYLLFRKWLKAGSVPCNQCFGEDTAEALDQAYDHAAYALIQSHDIVEST